MVLFSRSKSILENNLLTPLMQIHKEAGIRI
jgi:hypothetical protein